MSPFLAALNTPEARATRIIAIRAERARLDAIEAEERAARIAAQNAPPVVIEPMTDAEVRAFHASLRPAAEKYGANW